MEDVKKNISLGFRKALRYPTGAKDIAIELYISDKGGVYMYPMLRMGEMRCQVTPIEKPNNSELFETSV